MEYLLYLLIKYKYGLLFPLAVIEGPVICVIAGFLCRIGLLDLVAVYIILVAGDNIGDSIYYALGRFGRGKFLDRVSNRIGLTPERMEQVTIFIEDNTRKAISLSKVMLGVGVAGLFLAGRSRVSFSRFIKICVVTSMLQCAVYLCIGWFFGVFYQQINHYLNFFASVSIVTALALLLFLIVKSKIKKV